MKKIFILCALIVFLSGTRTASAEISPAFLASLIQQVQELLRKVEALQGEARLLEPEKIEAPKGEMPGPELMLLCSRPLSRGGRGEDVKELQRFLANSPTGGPELYPEGVISGYFGFFTERALKKFQVRNGAPPTGALDSATCEKIRGGIPAPVEIPTKKAAPVMNPLDSIESELLGVQKGVYLSPQHSERILNDLAALETRGYPKDKIESLRQIALGLSPHLQDVVKKETAATVPLPKTCVNEAPVLTADITDFSKIQKITSPGSPTNGQDKYKGHSFVWTGGERVPIFAPIPMTYDSGSYGKDNVNSPAQYLLFFTVNNYCDYQAKFDHIDEPVDSIKSQLPSSPAVGDSRTQGASNRVEFQAGDLIGYTSGTRQANNWDFGLYYMKEKGVLGTKYGAYGIHGHAVCWVDYFSPEKQARYRSLLEGNKLVCSF